MLDRLLGLETEYAIRYSPAHPADPRRPDHESVYDLFIEVLDERVATSDGARKYSRRQRFLENGGAIYYEYLPKATHGGLIEASTPECRGPSQLLLYQRAQERLLTQALPEVTARLRRLGFHGELGLLKNCRDAEGHIYGAQENYEAEVAQGAQLWLYRLALAAWLPVVFVTGVPTLAVVFALVGLILALAVIGLVLGGLLSWIFPRLEPAFDRLHAMFATVFALVERGGAGIGIIGTFVGMAGFALIVRAFAFRRVRRDMLAFLISRPVLTGVGSLDADGSFGLSEKGPAMRCLVRTTVLPGDRSIYDIGNLMKQLYSMMDLRLKPMWALFRRRQRLQLGLSDSNGCHHAEYLKLATTNLVLDMAEAGALRGLPRVTRGAGVFGDRRAIRALHAICADPQLEARVWCSDGQARTGLELQRLYLEAARRFVADSEAPSLEARELIDAWSEALDTLEREPAAAFGRLDWVTKRGLLDGVDEDGELGLAARKKIDLKYHELGVGYLARLEREALAPRLIGDAEIEHATREAPEGSPARRRSQLIRKLARAEEDVVARISWDHVEIQRGLLRREVIRLDDYR